MFSFCVFKNQLHITASTLIRHPEQSEGSNKTAVSSAPQLLAPQDGLYDNKNDCQIITLEKDDDIYKYLPDIAPSKVITLGGPYPFTKLRIILSTALGFAAGHNVECHFIKTFDFLNYVFPGHLFILETRRGDFFTFHENEGEQILTQEEIDQMPYPALTEKDLTMTSINMAQKLLEFYPKAETSKEPYYFYTPEYHKAKA